MEKTFEELRNLNLIYQKQIMELSFLSLSQSSEILELKIQLRESIRVIVRLCMEINELKMNEKKKE